MKDLTLKFYDKLQFKAFLSSLGWAEDEDLQNLSVSGMMVILSTFAFLMTCLMFLYSLIMSWSWKHRFGNGAERRK